MISSITCKYQGDKISIDEALRIRDANNGTVKGTFTCIECDQPVRAHKAGEARNHPAHFEHFERNPACSFSADESAVNRPRNEPEFETFEVEDTRAIEGYEQDRNIIARSRNPQISKHRKIQDDFTCQACGLRLEINGRFIIECHHLNPVSVAGVVEIGLEDLVSLCPTCHRIAHTRQEPYSIDEIKKILDSNI